MRRIVAVCSLVWSVLLGIQSPVQAGDFDPAKLALLREKMQKYVDDKVVAGAVTVIGSKNEVGALDAFGMLNIEQKAPMAKDALFRIASMTKPITAMGIMLLEEEKKLAVTDPVAKYLPEFTAQKLVVSREEGKVVLGDPARTITIRDLLMHVSGMPGGFPAPHADLYFKRDLTLKEAVELSAKQPLDFEPGSKWAYCNSGIDTLGRIIEVVSGQPYETFLAERIFKPLSMVDTTFYPTDEQLKRLAGLYEVKDGKLNYVAYSLLGPTKDAKHPIPAGGLYSTAPDLIRLYQMMLRRGTVGSSRIMLDRTAGEMCKLQTGYMECGFTPGMGWGYGWAVVHRPQGVHKMLSAGTYGHGGAFGTQAWIDPHQDLFVILLIQRIGLPNADGSDLRRDLQLVAVEARK